MLKICDLQIKKSLHPLNKGDPATFLSKIFTFPKDTDFVQGLCGFGDNVGIVLLYSHNIYKKLCIYLLKKEAGEYISTRFSKFSGKASRPVVESRFIVFLFYIKIKNATLNYSCNLIAQ